MLRDSSEVGSRSSTCTPLAIRTSMPSACGSGRRPPGRRGLVITRSRASGSSGRSKPTRAGCSGTIDAKPTSERPRLSEASHIESKGCRLDANEMPKSRRIFLKLTGSQLALGFAGARGAWAQLQTSPQARTIQTAALSIGYEDSGNAAGFPIVLLHGFPDDVRAFDGVVPPLVQSGYRVLVPYLRGYGPT